MVVDNLLGAGVHEFALHWLLADLTFQLTLKKRMFPLKQAWIILACGYNVATRRRIGQGLAYFAAVKMSFYARVAVTVLWREAARSISSLDGGQRNSLPLCQLVRAARRCIQPKGGC